jgi:hypothetical protein
MKSQDLLQENYIERVKDILDVSWRILKTRFIDGRHEITKEAPFQHYFAHIISIIGESYCTKRDDLFLVDLETKCEGIKGKNKYIDITCGFPNKKISCAIELKFKTNRQGAQDYGRIDAFIDIEALELACKKGFDMGVFYMITDSPPYINKSTKGVGTIFTTYDGAFINSGEYQYPKCKGRSDVVVNLENEYKIEWEKISDWYFLKINVRKPS